MESVTRAFLLSYQPPPLSTTLSGRPSSHFRWCHPSPPFLPLEPPPLFFFGFLQFPRPGKPCRCKLTEIGNKSRRYRCKTRDTDRPPPRNHLCSVHERDLEGLFRGNTFSFKWFFRVFFLFFFFLERKIFRNNFPSVRSNILHFLRWLLRYLFSKDSRKFTPELVNSSNNFPFNSL